MIERFDGDYGHSRLIPASMSMTCTLCGGDLPSDSWALAICTSDCVDAYVATELRVVTPHSHAGHDAAEA